MANEVQEPEASTTSTDGNSEGSQDSTQSEVSAYNFKNPSRVPKEQQQTLAMLHDGYAQSLATHLSAFLRCDIEIKQDEILQISFQEYLTGLASPACAAVIDMQPLSGYAVFEINPVILYAFVDRMLGGSGAVSGMSRGPTELELSVARKVFSLVLSELEEAWSHLLKIRFGLQSIQTNPGFISDISAQDACLVVQFKMKLQDSSGMATLCLPVSNLEPITSKLRSDQLGTSYGSKQTEEVVEAHRRNFHKVELELKAILGRKDLSMADFLALEAGDILKLDHRVSAPLEILIQGKPKYLGNPGLSGRRKAIAIMEIIGKELQNG